jgi:hypothetical protein
MELDVDGELGGDPADGDTAQLGPETTRCPWSKERERERGKPRVQRRRREGDGVLHRRHLLQRRWKQRRRHWWS